ncbi:MAG: primosomal protein N' [Alphaproteobacteria bacterium]|nr:primosomal protein N' [Alphaproteobacteria bacterium]
MEPLRASDSRESAPAPYRVGVMLPLPLDQAYDYAVTGGNCAPGAYVVVPFGKRDVVGVVWDSGDGALPDSRLKPIESRLDLPPMTESLRRLVAWTAAYTVSPVGSVLRMALSVPSAFDPPRTVVTYVATAATAAAARTEPVRRTPAREAVLALLADGRARTAAEIARATGSGAGVIKGLAAHGLVETVIATGEPEFPSPDWQRPRALLSAPQREAADRLVERVDRRAFSVTLLDGVTGSGKTEVYFEAIAAALAAGCQVLVLVPEIALTAQWLDRFAMRFGARPVGWHSDLSTTQRRAIWRSVATGHAPVVVGARSALFLPFPDLGLVVVDEEHDHSFKQEDGVIYNARDAAIMRARFEGCPAVLVSATPALETVENVYRGRYDRLALPERHAGATLPAIAVVDMRKETLARQSWISPPLRDAVAAALGAGEQAMLFLNRRGYAPLTLCRGCGHRLQCPNCTAWLVEHRLQRRLQCHHCGYHAPIPDHCPRCDAPDSFVPCGPGVERLNEEALATFPGARIAVMASDTLHGPAAAAALVGAVQAREIDVLIGTQVVAKGHHFPWLTVVGVIDADLGIAGGDLRAAERTYQLLHQVAGRAGRADRPGRVFLQTYDPDQSVMRALVSGERDRFIMAELAERRRCAMPPFGRLAAIIVGGPDEAAVEAAAAAFARTAPRDAAIEVLGPARPPLAVLRGRHRRRLLVKTDRATNLPAILRAWIDRVRVKGSVRVQVDVDPYSFV